MTLNGTIRVLTLAGLGALCTVLAQAQRGGGPPGGGGPGGAGPGGPGGGMNHQPMGNNYMGDRGNTAPPSMTQSPHTGPQLGPPGRWWDDKKTVKSVNLRSDQQSRMDTIFNTNKGQLLNMYSTLQREEARLSSLSGADLQDEAKVFAAIDRVAAAGADLEKAKAHIMLQIRKELDPTQLSALDKVMTSH